MKQELFIIATRGRGNKEIYLAVDESKKIIAETKKEIQSLQDTVMMADTASKAVKLYKENVAITFSSEEQIKKAIKVMSKVGVDFSPLLAPSKEAQEAIDKMFPDPTKQVNKINSLVKKMNKPQEKKYARIEEQNTVVEEAKMCTVEPPPLVGLKNKLSTNYCVGDLCYSDTAKVCKIDNTPPQYVADNLKLVSENILEKVRARFSDVKISSGYRCDELNSILKGADTSQHRTGEAIDMVFTKVKPYDVACWIRDNLEFDQLILESNTKGSVWVHCSYSKNQCRKEVLTYKGKKPYLAGLIP